ncbi:4Fe-4S dicluster domain-containing protein [Magnetospira sp. QH-2]|uniref:4Fe-4S dicluster domain-containing protein n=1 Tax=Magnetospira sp. (strain QH-2) TaxID=1288970 RepID=UPI0003E80FE0|nr:4Fe-4S dicluster domain-containing protein [Magnetospira sp. QH-2]CCQ74981.1 putative 4Fe-4S ferredoxin, iron-sulfur binding domain protein [Magnetospira sp. QH-2]
MTKNAVEPTHHLIDVDGLNRLIAALNESGHQVIGPTVQDSAVVYAPISGVADLPRGVVDRQEPGGYVLEHPGGEALFDHVVGPTSWKRYLFPPQQTLWTAKRATTGFHVTPAKEDIPRYAFIGARGCDIAAMEIQDRVFMSDTATDPGYHLRRKKSFVVAIHCGRPAETCFCTSMDCGPRAENGFDLALIELAEEDRHVFLVTVGSKQGAALLETLPVFDATQADIKTAEARIQSAANGMDRELIPDAAEVLAANLECDHWEEVAKRCLNCANCTMVCPTCFCSTVEDVTNLTGDEAWRERRWDSCFTLDYSYIHGGNVRQTGASRYRQWITHKLSHWHDQFGTSGCTGCGRCITWCPVGIDITEEARAIKNRAGSST